MKQSGLLLGAIAASSYAAPSPDMLRTLSKRLDLKSFALPEKCYFGDEQPSEDDESLDAKLSQKATTAGPGGDNPRWEYLPIHRGGQIPILPKWSHFHALGDSYSAGPGAGEYFGEDGGKYGDDWCYRTKGSYAVQLITNNEDRDFFDLGPEEQFQFLSCTGHVTKDVVDYQIPQLDFHDADTHMTVSLSIGGNDLGFSDTIKQCLLNRLDPFGVLCKRAKNNARNLITNGDGKNTFRDSLYKVWNGLQNPKTGQFPMVAHTLYPTFFNDQSANCDTKRLYNVGNYLTSDIRREFNELVDMANKAIIKHLDDFSNLNAFALGRFFPIEVDQEYQDHRLCEPFVESLPGFDHEDVWFFGVGSSDSIGDDEDGTALESRGLAARSNAPLLDEIDPETCDPDHKDMGHAWGCMMVQHNQTSEEDVLVHLDKRLPQFVTKAFHPKTAGFTATVEAMKLQLPRDAGRTGGRKRSLPGTPTKRQEDKPEGWNDTFDGKLSDDVFIPEVSYPINVAVSGMVPCTNQLETIMGTLGEAHFVDIEEANVVLMYDGVADILEADDEEAAFNAWKELYDGLKEEVGDNTVILASSVLPPPGLDDDLKQRFAKVNDRIVEHLKGLSLDQHTIAIDQSQFVAGPNVSDEDVSVEDLEDEKYVAMLHAWLNGASHAAINLDWIDKYTSKDPNPEPPKPKPTVEPPKPTDEPSEEECEGNQVFGDCKEATLEDTDFGPRAPICRKAIGDHKTSKLISEDKAREAASIYCKNLVDGKVVLNKDKTTVSPGSSDGAIDGGKINLVVMFDSKSCSEGAEQKVDFGDMGLDKCYENLYLTLRDVCGIGSGFEEYNEDYPMLGGTWGNDCALWDITGK